MEREIQMFNLDGGSTLLTERKRDVEPAKCSKLYVGTRCRTVDWFHTVEMPSLIARRKRWREEKMILFQNIDGVERKRGRKIFLLN